MAFEGDDDNDVLAEIFGDDEDEVALAPVFVGHRMEAELIRSLLEANDIPAAVFGSGGLVYGANDPGPTDRVMVRSDHVQRALETIRHADVSEDGIVEPTAEDEEVIVGHYEEEDDDDDDYGFEDEDEDEEWDDATHVEVLAERSDWGPRIVGLIGIAALVIAILVIVAQET